MSSAFAHVLERLYEVTGYVPRGSATERSARCPAHDDRQPSLSVGVKQDGVVVVKCHGGPQCPTEDIVTALGLPMSALWPAELQGKTKRRDNADRWMPCGHDKVAEYLYRDEHGVVLYGVARCALKGNGCQGFRQWRPDPTNRSGRRWSLREDGELAVRLVPYRLPEVLAAIASEQVVMICEGEKDVETLSAHRAAATCNPMGAGKWLPEFAQYFHGADVSIVADRDAAGRKHAEAVVANLLPVARSIYVVQAAHGKDAADHLAAGATLGDFITVWEPKPYILENHG
ncbi:toprim domain-containing protein [Streptosporangium roseum]|uniref:toprim domain-containing protein n=1 Tax=Streptosporangium roseum TaxID=2001 RepID=UPI00068CDE1F|nr:toprim domain-containing protein [Streptosporangium roseum]